MWHSLQAKALLAIAAVALASPDRVEAAIFTVGIGAGCTHSTLQAALNTASSETNADTIRLSNTVDYLAQAAGYGSGNQQQNSLDIEGGYATCASTVADAYTVLDGTGGAARPVLLLNLRTSALVRLRRLIIIGGDVSGNEYGGGILYNGGGGRVELYDTSVIANTAGYGGGIYVEGGFLVIGENSLVAANDARISGGGIYLEGGTLEMRPGTFLANNRALDGYGGGLRMLSGSGHMAVASINSASIAGNEARYGGGVAMQPNDPSGTFDTRLELYTSLAAEPAEISNNRASELGGGIYAKGIGSFGSNEVHLHDFNLDANRAPKGAAVYFASGSSVQSYSALRINGGVAPPIGAVRCSGACNRISGNRSLTSAGVATDGAIIHLERRNILAINRTTLSDNQGGPLLSGVEMGQTFDDGLVVGNSLLERNRSATGPTSQGQLIRMTGNAIQPLRIYQSTIVGNEILGTHVLDLDDDSVLQRSIVWQPGTSALIGGGQRQIEDILANDIGSLVSGGVRLINVDPRFIDPTRRDYRLRAASPGVDFAATSVGPDLLGNARGNDLPIVANRHGPADLGAYERPALLPLVLNPDFDRDARLWTGSGDADSSWTWSAAQNHVGATGSGSVFVTSTGFNAVGPSQCIHVPGPASYLLNGWGRVRTATNQVALRWEFRRNGGEACTAGSADQSGVVTLSTSTTTWTRAVEAAAIAVPPAEWTSGSSITVTLVAGGREPSGWFDGISLALTDVADRIFADDFEP